MSKRHFWIWNVSGYGVYPDKTEILLWKWSVLSVISKTCNVTISPDMEPFRPVKPAGDHDTTSQEHPLGCPWH